MLSLQVPWGGVTLLPFVDEKTLERIALPLLKRLPPEVLQRNGVGKVVLLMRKQHEQHQLEGQQQKRNCGDDVCARLSTLGAAYQAEFLFFKHKILSKRYDIAIDLLHLVGWLNGESTPQRAKGEQKLHRSVFRSSLPFAFPDILDSCVVEEEVLVLPPPLVARLDEVKARNVLRLLRHDLLPHQAQHDSSRAAADTYATLVARVLQNTDICALRQQCGSQVSLPPTPSLHPFDYELLYPTIPLPGGCADAAALTPSLYVKCFAVSLSPSLSSQMSSMPVLPGCAGIHPPCLR